MISLFKVNRPILQLKFLNCWPTLIELSYIGGGNSPKLGYCPQAPIRIPPLTSTPNCAKYIHCPPLLLLSSTAVYYNNVMRGRLWKTMQGGIFGTQGFTFYYTAGWHFIPQVKQEQQCDVRQFHNIILAIAALDRSTFLEVFGDLKFSDSFGCF